MTKTPSTAPSPPRWYHGIWHLIGLLVWDLLFRVCSRVTVIGRGHIPPRGATNILICANHISAIDPFLIGSIAMPRFSPVWWRAPAKEELFVHPVMRTLLNSWGAFPVRRGQRDFASMERMMRLLDTSVIVIFPEGKWSKTSTLLPGRPGVGRIIHTAKPTVIPVAIVGTDHIVPRDHALPRIGRRATIAFGPPIDLSRFYTQPDTLELSQQIVDTVMASISELYEHIKKVSS
jgi:1-acyl-sn-glycerol-3-phosphate acyltransferase